MLKAIYDTLEDVPEQFRELYTERDGKFEFTGVEGLKTQADVERVQRGAEKEREEHKATKEKLKKFGDLDPDKVHADMDEVEELRIRADAAGDGKIDEEKLEQLVEQRVRRQVAPIERENARLKEEGAALTATNLELQGTITSGKIEREIRKHAEAAKIVPTAIDDVVAIGRGVFEVAEDGAVVTRDNVGVTPGVGVDVYLTDAKQTRPHWWPTSTGGGAGGDGNDAAPGTDNPWSEKSWNLTKQGEAVRTLGMEKAGQLAKAANSHIGATAPTAAKSAA